MSPKPPLAREPLPPHSPSVLDRILSPDQPLSPAIQARLHQQFLRRTQQIFLDLQLAHPLPIEMMTPAEQIGVTANLWMRAQEMALKEIARD